jgi:putative spermidine/putrescine transport system permease protein
MMAAVSALMILVATVTMIIIDRMFGLDRLLVGKG